MKAIGITVRRPGWRLSTVLVLTLAAVWVAGAGASGEVATVCGGDTSSVSGVLSSLVVADDSTCYLSDSTTVRGDVTVGENSTLSVCAPLAVGGSVYVQRGAFLDGTTRRSSPGRSDTLSSRTEPPSSRPAS